MEATRRPHTADPEFDPLPTPRHRLRDFDPAEHQRLVVNPFLALLGLIGLARLALWLMETRVPGATFGFIPLAFTLPFLVQYHCLDCGRTRPYPVWRRHACPGVVARWTEGRRRGMSWHPRAGVQMVAWFWVIGSAAVLAFVVEVSRSGD